ncbi:MAG: hypothetical protein PHP03_00245 [Candidatus Pacebacteria bacterium]|nr:hypothetical protein [Candidatus Paceibacterota bacterium]
MSKSYTARMNSLLLVSFLLAVAVVLFGGLKEKETIEIIGLVVTLSVTMAGFGLVAFQIGHSTDELKKDFIESSIIMILSTISGFFFLVYPNKSFFGLNFGEVSIFLFFWSFILFLIILIDRRFDILK